MLSYLKWRTTRLESKEIIEVMRMWPRPYTSAHSDTTPSMPLGPGDHPRQRPYVVDEALD